MNVPHPFLLPPGPVDLADFPTRHKLGFKGSKEDGKGALEKLGPTLSDVQEKLFAEGKSGGDRSILLVLQGMDTSGKGGILRHTVGLVDPQGIRIKSFKAPTKEEQAHDFLWRAERALPEPGHIGVFDRSHYEDVLIARVRKLASAEEIERRYDAICEWEQGLVEGGTTVIKCMLHISPDEQRKRLLARLDNPTKHWKFNPKDVDERALWPAYQRAYEIALERTNTESAPWHIVPSDRKWFRNLTIAQLLLDTLDELDPQWPEADFDVDAERRRIENESPIG